MNISITNSRVTINNVTARQDPFAENRVHFLYQYHWAYTTMVDVLEDRTVAKVDVPVRLVLDHYDHSQDGGRPPATFGDALVRGTAAFAVSRLVEVVGSPSEERILDAALWDHDNRHSMPGANVHEWWLSRFAQWHIRWLPLGSDQLAPACHKATGHIRLCPWETFVHPGPDWQLAGPGVGHRNFVNGRMEAV